MPDGFEEWTRAEIGRLRAEADALENTLERYLHSRPRNVTITPGASSVQIFASRKRRSKNDAILDAIDQAGPSGLSLDEIMAAAQRAGITSNRNTIRSFCWNEKQHGRLTQPDVGRFASARAAVRDEAAGTPPDRDPAASDTPQHAVPARGGGI